MVWVGLMLFALKLFAWFFVGMRRPTKTISFAQFLIWYGPYWLIAGGVAVALGIPLLTGLASR